MMNDRISICVNEVSNVDRMNDRIYNGSCNTVDVIHNKVKLSVSHGY